MKTKRAVNDVPLRKHGQGRDIWRRLCRNKLAVVSMIILALIVLSAIFAPLIAPYDYAKQDYSNTFCMPNGQHWMGTDNYGRDIFSRVIWGGRISLLVSIIAVAMSLAAGCLLGATAAYFGGAYDSIVMRTLDIIMAIPQFLLAVCINAALGSGLFNTALAIAVGGVPTYARLMRATTLTIADQEYVEAARAIGNKSMRIILRHIIPNTLSPIIVDSTLRIGYSILSIAGLSFIGLGIQPPTPEWGSILNAGKEYIRDFWPIVVFPGLAIMVTLFAFNLLGDGLRDAMDPRLKD